MLQLVIGLSVVAIGGAHMTTGLGKEPRTTMDERRSRRGWIWAVIAAVIVIGLLVWAFNAVRNNNGSQPGATTGSVQDSATGQQGAVGGFAEQVKPNENGTPSGGTSGSMQGGTPGTAQGGSQGGTTSQGGTQGGATSQGGRTSSGGQDMGAGSTGINTATDSVGGSSGGNTGPSSGND
jgi:hypothetical protein